MVQHRWISAGHTHVMVRAVLKLAQLPCCSGMQSAWAQVAGMDRSVHMNSINAGSAGKYTNLSEATLATVL